MQASAVSPLDDFPIQLPIHQTFSLNMFLKLSTYDDVIFSMVQSLRPMYVSDCALE